MARKKTAKPPPDLLRWFDCSLEVTPLVVMIYVQYWLSLRNVENLQHERGIDICHDGGALVVVLWPDVRE